MATIGNLGGAILQGSALALKIIQQFLANPTIAGVPIECEKYTEINEASVSQQLIIAPLEFSLAPAGAIQNTLSNSLLNSSGKQYITDNIAPKPRTFNMKGWIAPSFFEITAISPVLLPIMNLKIAQLRKAFNSRELLLFTTKNHEETLNVGIVNMVFDSEPEIMNRQPITITVREVPILTSTFSTGGATPIDIGNASSVASATSSLTAVSFLGDLGAIL